MDGVGLIAVRNNRAVPVVEAAASIALCDLLIGEGLLHRQER